MAVTLETIERHLDACEIPYERDGERLIVACTTGHYRNDADGDRTLRISIWVDDEGQYVEFAVIRAYSLRRSVNPGAVCELLAGINGELKSLCWELDRTDGEIRGTVGLSVGDGGLTVEAVRYVLELIPRAIDFWHPVIHRALTTGELPPVLQTRPDPRLEEVVARAGGVDQMRELLERHLKRQAGPDG